MMIVPIITSGQLSRGDCSKSHRFSQRMPFRSFLAPLLKKAFLRTEPTRCVQHLLGNKHSNISTPPTLLSVSAVVNSSHNLRRPCADTERTSPPLILQVSCFAPCGSSEALQSTQRSHQHSGNFEEIGFPRPVVTSEKRQPLTQAVSSFCSLCTNSFECSDSFECSL